MGIRISLPGTPVTLVEGGSFCVSHPSGDIADQAPCVNGGLYVAERRLLSRLVLTVNGHQLDPVDHHRDDPAAATFVGRVPGPPPGDGPVVPGPVVIRRRTLAAGMRDEIEVRNLGGEPSYVEIEIDLGADLAPLAAVRDGGTLPGPVAPGGAGPHEVLFVRGRGPGRVGCRVTATDGVVARGAALCWEAIVPARGTRSFTLVVAPIVAGAERVLDPEFPGRAVVAAAAPWYLALHGRDALLTAWMSLIVDPELALGTLETLARFQGTDVDERTEEQPGRILHRLRFGTAGFGADAGGAPPAGSYGSVDSTPLFVMLLGELRRWGLAPEVVDRLLPHADRALDWITRFGDCDGDGYVEYQRATDRGERHQAWKDSARPVRYPDGSEARGPLALAEVQGYVYAAYRARSHFAAEVGDDAAAEAWAARAAALRSAFNRD